ncbi:hypothetical protein BDY19DRAFT_997245 [Irpex rosettiformis]|uniref:Uncharacterized protein n=1 Tax=Irpex rosettiformis TaxID=378272 RepID=A0ACB8TT22_9APHY|nr:hypothetical protein BDY19DRAFT_997245 [Irpex rosettiformis]
MLVSRTIILLLSERVFAAYLHHVKLDLVYLPLFNLATLATLAPPPLSLSHKMHGHPKPFKAKLTPNGAFSVSSHDVRYVVLGGEEVEIYKDANFPSLPCVIRRGSIWPMLFKCSTADDANELFRMQKYMGTALLTNLGMTSVFLDYLVENSSCMSWLLTQSRKVYSVVKGLTDLTCIYLTGWHDARFVVDGAMKPIFKGFDNVWDSIEFLVAIARLPCTPERPISTDDDEEKDIELLMKLGNLIIHTSNSPLLQSFSLPPQPPPPFTSRATSTAGQHLNVNTIFTSSPISPLKLPTKSIPSHSSPAQHSHSKHAGRACHTSSRMQPSRSESPKKTSHILYSKPIEVEDSDSSGKKSGSSMGKQRSQEAFVTHRQKLKDLSAWTSMMKSAASPTLLPSPLPLSKTTLTSLIAESVTPVSPNGRVMEVFPVNGNMVKCYLNCRNLDGNIIGEFQLPAEVYSTECSLTPTLGFIVNCFVDCFGYFPLFVTMLYNNHRQSKNLQEFVRRVSPPSSILEAEWFWYFITVPSGDKMVQRRCRLM